MTIQRDAHARLLSLASQFPVVVVTGPRQSGKTTLCRAAFPDKPYVLLETPSQRKYATEDAEGFLNSYPDGAIFDEIQRVPELTSYLQGRVDSDPRPGKYVLTGSHNFEVMDIVSQSLAGRSGQLRLLPCTIDEVGRFSTPPKQLWDFVVQGGYPRLHDRNLPAETWYENYVQSYLERDLRHLLRVADLSAFDTFLRLCAGRSAQLLNFSQLASDCGVASNTARSWLSILEASYLVMRVTPYYRNLNKRLVKTSKLYFLDSGLVCYLLGIHDARQLATHPLRGAIFETFVFTECIKTLYNDGRRAAVSFFRDSRGREVDCLIERGATVLALEMKSGSTVANDFFDGLRYVSALFQEQRTKAENPVAHFAPAVVYGGDQRQQRRDVSVLPWRDCAAWLRQAIA